MYPQAILGIAMSSSPDGRELHGHFLESADRETARRLIRELPANRQLQFYDGFYPTISDPGAYITIEIRDGRYYYHPANHGWSGDRRLTSPELLIEYLLINIEHNVEKHGWGGLTVRSA